MTGAGDRSKESSRTTTYHHNRTRVRWHKVREEKLKAKTFCSGCSIVTDLSATLRQLFSSKPMTEPRDAFDSPWKDVLEAYFQDFMQFFFPQIHADIDWSRGYDFLDQ
jgi:hypothetical protein